MRKSLYNRFLEFFPLGIVAATVFSFWPILHSRFVMWDDQENIMANFNFRGLSPAHLHWMFIDSAKMGNYIPLTWVTFGLDYKLWGMDPSGYHLTNLILHTVNAVLFFYVALALLVRQKSVLPAGLAAFFFAVHPLRTESVAWVTERRDVLSGAFFLVSILGYLYYARAKKRDPERWQWYLLTLLSYGCGLLSKPMVITLPIVLMLLDFYPLGRKKIVWLDKMPFFLLAVPIAILTIYLQSHAGFMVSTESLGFIARLRLCIYGIGFYIYKTILPFGLVPLYPIGTGVSWKNITFIASFLFIVIYSAFVIRVRHRWPVLLTVWLYYLVVLLPVSGLFLVGRQIAADRFTYLPCMGWAILFGILAASVIETRSKTFIPIVITLLFGFIGLTRQQCGVWKDSMALWSSVLSKYPDSVLAHNNLAVYLQGKGRFEEAITQYREALRVKPDFAPAESGLGIVLQQEKKMDEAEPHFEKALLLNPLDAIASTSLGVILLIKGQSEQAIECFKRSIQINPEDEAAHTDLGVALMMRNQLDEAIAQFETALHLQPTDALAHQNLGSIYRRRGQMDLAEEHFRQAQEAQSGDHWVQMKHSGH